MEGFVSLPAIVVLVYLIGMIYKAVPSWDTKFIPPVCGVSGGVIALAMFFTTPEVIAVATDPWTAGVIGIVSGLAATGLNETLLIPKKNNEV